MAERALTVRILAETRDAEQGLDRVESKTAGMGQAFKNAAALAATYLAGKALAAVADYVGDSVRAFSDLEESLNALEVQYGGHAEGIKQLGRDSAQALGTSNAEFNQYAVSVSAFASQIAGDGGNVVEIVDELSRRTADFASVMNLDFGEASQKFRSGLAGESEPLRQFGIDVSAARVESFALANGIAAAGEEMTEAQKVQARFGTIMEQTAAVQGDFARTADDYANAQRIAAAETENLKARTGEALVPFEQMRTELELLGAKTLGILSTQIRELTGGISDADSGIQQFEIHMGQSADTAEAALTIVKEYGGGFDELLPRLNLTREELVRLRDADEEFLRSMGFTEAQVGDLADAVQLELASAMTDAERTARQGFTPALEDLEGAQGDVEDATDDATGALEEQNNKLRAMSDPLFGVINATRDLEQAEKDYQTAVEEGDTQGQLDAIQDIQDANLDLRGSYQALVDSGIDPTSQAARNMFRDVGGLSGPQIDQILGTFRSIQDQLPVLDLSVRAPGIRYTDTGGGNVTPSKRREYYLFADGGIARHRPGGIAARIAEAGEDEVVSPLDQLLGMVRDAVRDELAANGGRPAGGVVELRVSASRRDPLDGWAIVEALQRVERESGPIPVRVRT